MWTWITNLLSEEGKVSAARFCLVVIVIAAVTWMSVWLGLSLHKTGLVPNEWVNLAEYLIGFAFGGKVISKFSENKQNKPNNQQDTVSNG